MTNKLDTNKEDWQLKQDTNKEDWQLKQDSKAGGHRQGRLTSAVRLIRKTGNWGMTNKEDPDNWNMTNKEGSDNWSMTNKEDADNFKVSEFVHTRE